MSIERTTEEMVETARVWLNNPVIPMAMVRTYVVARVALGWSQEDKSFDDDYFIRSLVDAVCYPGHIEDQMRRDIKSLYLIDDDHGLPTCRHIYPLRCSAEDSRESFALCYYYPFTEYKGKQCLSP